MSSMVYSYFPGGYFDADGAPHFLHTDYQGSVVMVTDSAGCVEQHTAYYPYGEPHREPAGQPILYAGKERLRTTADLAYGARRHHAPLINWTVPDPKAHDNSTLSPYSFCAANPIWYTDPTGMIWENPQEADALKNEIELRLSDLNNDLSSQINKQKNGKDTSSAISELNEMIVRLNQSVTDINRIGDDKNNSYRFVQVDGDNAHYVKKADDGVIEIHISTPAMAVHENTHVRQALDAGGPKFDPDGFMYNTAALLSGSKVLMLLSQNEVDAYQAQYAFDRFSLRNSPSSILKVNVDYVGNLKDKNGYLYPDINRYAKFLKQTKQPPYDKNK